MRRKEREIKSTKEIENIINRAETLYLAMLDGGAPYVVPLNFGYKDGAIYFHSAPQGRKITALKFNPKVCFAMHTDFKLVEADKACGWGAHYKSVIGFGVAEFVINADDKRKALSALMKKYSGREFDFCEKDFEKVVIIKITIESITGKKNG